MVKTIRLQYDTDDYPFDFGQSSSALTADLLNFGSLCDSDEISIEIHRFGDSCHLIEASDESTFLRTWMIFNDSDNKDDKED